MNRQFTEGMKDTNPKAAAGAKKIPLASVPAITSAFLALGHHEGKSKYGGWNWRIAGASAATYISACKRHLDLWFEGEWADQKTGIPHLANALACISIIVDSINCGTLEDDRPPNSLYSQQVGQLNALVESLNEMFGGMNPEHFTQQGEFQKRQERFVKEMQNAIASKAIPQHTPAPKHVRAKVPASKAPVRGKPRGK